MNTSIAELRERLQGPRRPYDTWYGKRCMRPLSIYLTVAFAAMGFSPSAVTFLSLAAGLLGALFFWMAWWGWGLIFVNLWYLLDHVDGELARLRGTSSPTGLYFDTIVNAIVPPLALLSMGVGLRLHTERELPFFFGLVASYASMMLLMITYCESAVMLQCAKGGAAAAPSESAAPKRSAAGALFGAVHTAVTFPVFLPVTTFVMLAVWYVLPAAKPLFLMICLTLYALAATFVWTAALAHAVWTRKLDRRLAG